MSFVTVQIVLRWPKKIMSFFNKLRVTPVVYKLMVPKQFNEKESTNRDCDQVYDMNGKLLWAMLVL